MNKRKVLEANRRQKSMEKGSVPLQPKTSNIFPSKSPEPLPIYPLVETGIQHGDAEISPNPPRNFGGNKKSPVPKTKFTCNDKSSDFHSSPRLKCFPAEELRRYDASPRIETSALPPFQINGEGDSLQVPHSSPNLSHQNTMNQQIMSEQIPRQCSPERQAHRPCVPRPVDYENRMPIEHQSEGNFIKKKETIEEMAKQQVGDSNRHNSKTSAVSEEQTPPRNLRNHVQFAAVHENSPQGIYYEHYIPNQQMPLQYICELGMTSPQDVTINAKKMHQYPHQQPVYPEQAGIPYHYAQQGPNQQEEQQHEYPCQRPKNNEENNVKALQFTHEMIRDQERLVQTLQQQGFTDDIIRRQFDALLSEQKRQLVHLHEIEKIQNSADNTNNEDQPRRRRITRIEEDEKPEWMMHITPPWVSYASLERQSTNDNQKEQKNDEEKRQVSNEDHSAYQQQIMGMHRVQQQQMIDPRVLQQQMMQINAHNHGQCPCNHQHSHQSVPNNFSPQNHSSNHQENMTIQQQAHQENYELISQSQRGKVEPSSLLKLRMYKEVVKRQKQNNGLQDPETIREAMAALKNPANRKGLEYLENMEKREKQVRLNGAQDPDERVMQNWPHCPPEHIAQQMRKEPSANGLENRRNPNNPLPQPTLHLKNTNAPMPLYPGRNDPNEYYYASNMIPNPQNFAPVFQNTGDPVDNGYKNHLPAQVYAQVQGGNSENQNHGSCCIGQSYSLPYDMKNCSKEQGEFYVQRQHMHGQEPMMIGGIMYLGRKAEFIPSSNSPDAAMGNRGQEVPPGYQYA